MKIHCYSRHHQGDRLIGEKEPLANHEITSGLCDECFPKEMEDLRRWREFRTLTPNPNTKGE